MDHRGIGRRQELWIALLLTCALAVPARAQFWSKKDYRHWSEKECWKMLTDSPWAQTRTFSAVEMPSGAQGGAVPGRQPLISITYTAIFFSALPVREAQVRLGLIQADYDKMSSPRKKAFDQNAAKYLSVPFPDDVVIQVNYSTNVDAWRTALQNVWQLQTTAIMKNSAFLATHGKTIPLSRYEPGPKNEQDFFLFFPRSANGEPALKPTFKSLTLQVTRSVLPSTNGFLPYNSPVPQQPPAGNLSFEFNVKKMQFGGKLAY